jgi:hypothetical protein
VTSCDRCRRKSITFIRYSGAHLCGDHLCEFVEKRAKPEMSESEKRVKEIRNEVLEALTKLERIDVENKQQET